jgi:hypothetical protein
VPAVGTVGTIAANGAVVSLGKSVALFSTCAIGVSGTWSGTLAFEVQNGAAPWSSLATTTSNGNTSVPVAANQAFQVAATAWSSGTATIQVTCSPAAYGSTSSGGGSGGTVAQGSPNAGGASAWPVTVPSGVTVNNAASPTPLATGTGVAPTPAAPVVAQNECYHIAATPIPSPSPNSNAAETCDNENDLHVSSRLAGSSGAFYDYTLPDSIGNATATTTGEYQLIAPVAGEQTYVWAIGFSTSGTQSAVEQSITYSPNSSCSSPNYFPSGSSSYYIISGTTGTDIYELYGGGLENGGIAVVPATVPWAVPFGDYVCVDVLSATTVNERLFAFYTQH